MKLHNIQPGTCVPVWAVMINTDTTEGRGTNYAIAYFWSRYKALEYAKGKDTMGSDGKVKEVKCIMTSMGSLCILGDEVTPFELTEDKEREEAKAKLYKALTAKERELLGIDV
tara:strand:+ start:1489 stop:1827 length:339 start_codon:yes stop_codon:yes gene_type:complete